MSFANKPVDWALAPGLCFSAVFKMRMYTCPHPFLLGNLCCHLEARAVTLSAQVTLIRRASGGLRDRVSTDCRSRAVMWCNVLFRTVNRRGGGDRACVLVHESEIESGLLSLGSIWLVSASVPDRCCDFRRQKVRIVDYTDEIEWGHEDLFTGKQEDFYCSLCQG